MIGHKKNKSDSLILLKRKLNTQNENGRNIEIK